MKIDELKKALRGLIKEEVKRAVAEEVSRAMGKVLVEMVKEIKTNNNNSPVISEQREYIAEEVEPAKSPINTSNPRLNSVLAETARYSKPLPRQSSAGLVDLMDGGFDRIGQSESAGVIEKPATNMDFLKQMVGNSPMVPQQQSVLDGGADIPDVLKGVFKKDFRAVMKKIDESKKNGGGGFIDPSRVLGG